MLTSKRMKYIGSLFVLVFVYPKHFLLMLKNRGHMSLLLLNLRLLICSAKVHFLFNCTLFISASVTFQVLSQTAKWNITTYLC